MERKLLLLDLNLLKGLHILLEERNLRQAAKRLFVTPSAMSKMLHRLRDAFDDALLVHTEGGLLVPTPRAEELADQLITTIQHLENLVMPTIFDPKKVRRKLRIAYPETFGVAVMPNLLAALHVLAPKLQFESQHLGDAYLERLAKGSLDFVIYIEQKYPDEYIKHSLFCSVPTLWCRKGHPITKCPEVTLKDICSFPKIAFDAPSVKLDHLNEVIREIEQAGFSHDVILHTSHLLISLGVMSKTNLVMLGPDYIFRYQMLSDTIVGLPVDHIPQLARGKINLCLIQHERTLNSPFHQWVISEIVKAVKQPLSHE
ncbi:MAG: LysR family transcriptional regulator [Sterolibacterium sp.]|nr:LysR family transcriptional regulator [Sterolibacterium sp.]